MDLFTQFKLKLKLTDASVGEMGQVVVPKKVNKQNKTRANSRLPPKENKQNKLLTN